MLEGLDWARLREEYRNASPWPHLVVDNVITPETAARVADEVAQLPDDALVRRRSRRVHKLSSLTEGAFGPATREVLDLLSGPVVTRFAETVTGVATLEADRTFCRAGLFVFPPGGWQRVHEDFPVHPHTGLWNRVVLLLYCSEWQPGYGGGLELWPPDMKELGRRVDPVPGRLVLFEPTRAHPHGVEAVSEVAGGPRVTVASRLYSNEAPVLSPNRAVLRWSRRPSEHRRDVWPTASEVLREVRSRMRRRTSPAHGAPDRDEVY